MVCRPSRTGEARSDLLEPLATAQNRQRGGCCIGRGYCESRGHWYGTIMARDFRDVDPRDLRVPSSRRERVDPLKLHRQIAQYGSSVARMQPLWVQEAADGTPIVYNGDVGDTYRQVGFQRARTGRGDRGASHGV